MAKLDLASEHVQANTSGLAYYSDFTRHRDQMTAIAQRAAPSGNQGSLCVLGAGNCYDLDLAALANCYAELHLVDIDAQALTRATSKLEPATRNRVITHAPVDLSGLYDRIERWARFEVTPEELISHGANTAAKVRQGIGRSFDVVISACMLSQMQLSVLHALGDRHQLFQAVRFTLNLTHFRTLADLTAPNGRVLFVTDVTADTLFPLARDAGSPLELLSQATNAQRVFDFANPHRLAELLADDPVLKRAFPSWDVTDAWVWTNGPETTFLVYCATLLRA